MKAKITSLKHTQEINMW